MPAFLPGGTKYNKFVEPGYYHGVNGRILARVPAGANRILDVGCAAGLLGKVLKEQNSAREVWGLEIVPQVAAEAKLRLDHVLVGDVEQMDPLPLPEHFFDCVICGDVLEHLKEPGTFLRRLRKHLLPAATLIANVPNIAHWSIVMQLLQGQFSYANKGLLDRTHLRFFTPESFREMLWEVGYLVTESDSLEVRQFFDLFGNPTPGDPAKAVGQLASGLGLDSLEVERTTATYQQLFVAKAAPDPYAEPEKMAALVGPHIGELMAASKRCSVIVLTYNSMKTIEDCLASVLPTLGVDDELIVVDNASTDGTPYYLDGLTSSDHPLSVSSERKAVRIVFNEENFGFSKGCNVGILASKGGFVILLNPDTVVYPGWIDGLIEPFSDETVGAVGPLSDNVCGDQFIGLHLRPEHLTSRDQITRAISERLAPGTQRPTKLLIGFCLALRRNLLDQFGLLEGRCFLGADDLEMSWRLTTLGFKLVVVSNTFVSHEGSGSFDSIGTDRKMVQVHASDAALIEKLTRYYVIDALPSSRIIWGNEIFQEALLR